MKWKNYDSLYSAVAKLDLDVKRFAEIGFDLSSWELEELKDAVFKMKDSELTEERFVELLTAMKRLDEHYFEISKELENLCEDSYIFFNTYSDNLIDALSDELGDKYDTLSYFYYDTNCSKDYDAYIEDADGNKTTLKTYEDAYRYLTSKSISETSKPTAKDLANMIFN